MSEAKSSSCSGNLEDCVTAVIVGAGNRGTVYANFALDFPKRFKVVAVADPRAFRRETLQKQHSLDEKQLFEDWPALAKLDKIADVAVICTPDALHKAPAVAFAEKGYNILVEKPMAVTESDCEAIAAACAKNGVTFAVCHVLRFALSCLAATLNCFA